MFIKNYYDFINEANLLKYSLKEQLGFLNYTIKINWNPLNDIKFFVVFNNKSTTDTIGAITFTTNKNIFYSVISAIKNLTSKSSENVDLYSKSKMGKLFDVIYTFADILNNVFKNHPTLLCLTFTGASDQLNNLYRYILKNYTKKYPYSYFEDESGEFYLYKNNYTKEYIINKSKEISSIEFNRFNEFQSQFSGLYDDESVTDEKLIDSIKMNLTSLYPNLTESEIDAQVKLTWKNYKKTKRILKLFSLFSK